MKFDIQEEWEDQEEPFMSSSHEDRERNGGEMEEGNGFLTVVGG